MFLFKTKAQTLSYLRNKFDNRYFLQQEIINISEWQNNSDKIIKKIFNNFVEDTFAVRSSGDAEDSDKGSLAGIYDTILNVKKEKKEFLKAVNKIILSYKDDKANEILIQPMVKNTVVSGVLVTKDIKNGAPYTVINYDDFSGKTDTVTSGVESKCIYIIEESEDKITSSRFRKLLNIVTQIKSLTKVDELDIEFCFTQEKIYILQVRPLAMKKIWKKTQVNEIIDNVSFETKRLEKYIRNSNHKTVFLSNMADWNPAEMIGANPKRLSVSSYEKLITDETWYLSRASMGYNKFIHKPLMLQFSGQPYIDVELSLFSLIPQNLPKNIKEKILLDQILYLQKKPHLADKFEFNVAFSSLDFNFDDLSKKVLISLTATEINYLKNKLVQFTNQVVKEGLKKNYRTTFKEDINNESYNFVKDIDYIKSNGTFPFAISARHAFIAMSFLKSSVSQGVISENRIEEIFQNIKTIAHYVVEAINNLKKGIISKEKFNQFCGHLRPGTYDITSDRYDNNSNFLLQTNQVLESKKSNPDYIIDGGKKVLTLLEEKKMNDLLEKNKLEFSSENLVDYIISSTIIREENKFQFTKHLSNLIKKITIYGKKYNYSKEELSFLSIDEIKDLEKINIKAKILKRSNQYKANLLIKNPDFITADDNLGVVRYPYGKPNFITTKVVKGRIHILEKNKVSDFRNKILMIEAADPGYDWVLSQHISGLITKYGGANSHIAIRCAEFNIPAAIGCGERIYCQYSQGDLVEIDPQKEIVRILGNA